MMEVWKPEDEEQVKMNKCTKITTPTFPFLDMQLQWLDYRALSFRAFSKPGQLIQYVNNSSTHHQSCLHSIPHRVLKQLGRLTSNDQGQINETTTNQIYPKHIKALTKANLIPPPKNFQKWNNCGEEIEIWTQTKEQTQSMTEEQYTL